MSELTIELATIIAINAAKVQNYLVANKLPTPSFDVDAPKKSMIPPEAKEIEAAREAVIDATTKPRSLMLGPTDFLLSSTVSTNPSNPFSLYQDPTNISP